MVKKAKRGRKPGVKIGPYLTKKRKNELAKLLKEPSVLESPSTLSLCQQLEETIQRLENKISNSIGRLNELIGKI